ncbi:MAG TPA: BTAD domain-containing putative transcriptional regulator [Acetobacteraceae bacterium]|nr:BTAD domain-containing putative transcriptional regulator [Acetobacteraceae bacterium]
MAAWTQTGESLLPTGRKTRALLAVVALSAPRPALRGRLAELLWSRRPEEQARASLRQEIHRLLEALSPAEAEVLAVNRDHIRLTPGMVWVDVEQVMRASTSEPASLALLDGELLEDLDGIDPTFDSWLNTERERVRDRARTVAEALLREQEDPEALIPAAQRLLQIDRSHEGAWRAMMRAHAARGERGMAIQAYDRCRAVLADLLDTSPSTETQRLLAEIRGPSGNRPVPRPPPAPPPEPAVARHDPQPAPEPPGRDAHPGRDGPHVGVIPLQLLGTNEEEAQLASGLAEEITTALARFRWMVVVASNALARFAAGTRDETAIRQTFGLDYLLDGTIRRAPDRLRITLRLLDLRAGAQVVWAHRFDREPTDLLEIQDEIAQEVVARIDAEILQIEAKRSAAGTAEPVTAHQLMLRSIPLIGRLERDAFMRAGEFLLNAMELEPDRAAAFAWSAFWQLLLVSQGWADVPTAAIENAASQAERAVVLDPFGARGLTIAGHVRAHLQHRLREALALHERALSLNPNLAIAWALSAVAAAYTGDADEAKRRMEHYKRLSPHDPYAFLLDGGFILVPLLQRDHAAAAAVGRKVAEINPAFSANYKPYLSALGHLRQHAEAASVLRRLLVIEPGFCVQRFVARSAFDRTQDRDHLAEGLRLAGVPETAHEAVLESP